MTCKCREGTLQRLYIKMSNMEIDFDMDVSKSDSEPEKTSANRSKKIEVNHLVHVLNAFIGV